jgi:hypothetical protein
LFGKRGREKRGEEEEKRRERAKEKTDGAGL